MGNEHKNPAAASRTSSQNCGHSFDDLPDIVRKDGNWKKLNITNITAALRAAKGCRTSEVESTLKQPQVINVSFNYSEEILEKWR